jgi:purine-binding chemotaxis protein CheW
VSTTPPTKDPAPDTAAILRGRARALARVADDGVPDGQSLEILEFALANERYAVETRFVDEVQHLHALTTLPGTPPFVRGVVNLRGRILPVYDLKKFFALPEAGLTDLHRIVVVRRADFVLGLLADQVIGVRTLSRTTLAPSLATLTGIGAEFLLGVSEQRLVVLDLERILAEEKLVIDDDVDS